MFIIEKILSTDAKVPGKHNTVCTAFDKSSKLTFSQYIFEKMSTQRSEGETFLVFEAVNSRPNVAILIILDCYLHIKYIYIYIYMYIFTKIDNIS